MPLNSAVQELLLSVQKLRDPKDGCPWDLEQTHESLAPFALEEANEFVAAVMSKEMNQIKEELGDMLLQVVLHAQLASEKSHFNFQSLCTHLNAKIIKRHPHVFTHKETLTLDELEQRWQNNKKSPSQLKETLKLAPLLGAHKIGQYTKHHQFDWLTPQDVLNKVQEELGEVQECLTEKSHHDHIEEEIGDLLFSVVQLARHLSISADAALLKANHKFVTRYAAMEKLSGLSAPDFAALPSEKKEELWRLIKTQA
jgi:MazG family protein